MENYWKDKNTSNEYFKVTPRKHPRPGNLSIFVRFEGNFPNLAENFPVAHMSQEPPQIARRVGPGLLLELSGKLSYSNIWVREHPISDPLVQWVGNGPE